MTVAVMSIITTARERVMWVTLSLAVKANVIAGMLFETISKKSYDTKTKIR